MLGFADSPIFSGMDPVLMGGKEVEKKVGGRIEGFIWDGGMRW